MCVSNDTISFIRQPGAVEAGRSVRIFDTTLRDGEQTPGVNIAPRDKVVLAGQLEAFGAATIEAGFPASSPGDHEAVRRISELVVVAEVAALARCNRPDINAAVDALRAAAKPVVHIVLGTSDVHMRSKLGMTRTEVIRAVRDCVAYARSFVDTVQFSLEDATRTERPFLHQVVQVAVEAGAARINIPDTVGGALPTEFGPMIGEVVERVGPDVIVSAHCHNDLGLATANTIAAVMFGARQVEVALNGVGERAGNAAAEEVCVALELKGIARTGVDLAQIAGLSRVVAEVTRVPVQPNRALVGANAFAHSSGIHQDGILKDPRTYEYVSPRTVGVEGHRFVLTARSGRAAVAHQAATLGRTLAGDQVDQVYRAFIRVADQTAGAVTDEILVRIVEEVTGGSASSPKASALTAP